MGRRPDGPHVEAGGAMSAGMMVRWDPFRRRYSPAMRALPEFALAGNTGQVVRCASCCGSVLYDETYVSLELHEPMTGLGYAVCGRCYGRELERGRHAYELRETEEK